MLRLIFLLLLGACAGTSEVRKNLEEVYQSGGVEQYFLPELPDWANFSTLGDCKRTSSVQFLDFPNLSSSYQLNYEQAVQLQYFYNRNAQKMREELGKDIFTAEDQSYLFYNSYEQIIGGSREFIVPTYHRIHVIWIDHALRDKNVMGRLKVLLESNQMNLGHPVLLSMCLSAMDLENFIQRNRLDSYGVKYISMEMFTHYNSQFSPMNYFGLEFNQLMPNKEVHIFVPTVPTQFNHLPNLKKY